MEVSAPSSPVVALTPLTVPRLRLLGFVIRLVTRDMRTVIIRCSFFLIGDVNTYLAASAVSESYLDVRSPQGQSAVVRALEA